MKFRRTSVVAMGAALTFAGHLARPAEVSIRVPDTAAARSAAGLISRAERAIRRYMGACESTVAPDPPDVVTTDARIEYTLDDPGAYLSLDASSVLAACITAVASAPLATNLWIFPTGDNNAVLIQYDMSGAGMGAIAQRQIALVEMRGERISRMRNFGSAPVRLLTALHGKAQSDLCATLSRYEGSLVSNTTTRTGQRLHMVGAPTAFSP